MVSFGDILFLFKDIIFYGINDKIKVTQKMNNKITRNREDKELKRDASKLQKDIPKENYILSKASSIILHKPCSLSSEEA